MDRTELIHILISVITISLAFSLAALQNFWLILITVGIGFTLHELSHKFVAIRFGCIAVYRAWMGGLVLALVMAFATGGRFIFAAPGAVYIYKAGGLTDREDGLISLAGPFMNVLLAGFFLFLFAGTKFGGLGQIGFQVNMFLALFNLIPFGPLDGSKVFRWNKAVWAIFFIPLLLLNFVFL